MSTQAEVTTLCGAADTPVSMDSPSVPATEIGDLQPSATDVNAINRMQIDMNPIHDYAVEVPTIDFSDIDIKSIIEIEEHSIDVKSEDIDEASNKDVMSINRIEVDATLTQVKIERVECDLQVISTYNMKVEQEINKNEIRDLVLEFNLRELRVRLVKLSDSQIQKLTLTHSGDNPTSSRASQDVDQQQATSSDGKHTFLLNIFLQE
jgi:hypothetical protein